MVLQLFSFLLSRQKGFNNSEHVCITETLHTDLWQYEHEGVNNIRVITLPSIIVQVSPLWWPFLQETWQFSRGDITVVGLITSAKHECTLTVTWGGTVPKNHNSYFSFSTPPLMIFCKRYDSYSSAVDFHNFLLLFVLFFFLGGGVTVVFLMFCCFCFSQQLARALGHLLVSRLIFLVVQYIFWLLLKCTFHIYNKQETSFVALKVTTINIIIFHFHKHNIESKLTRIC